MRGIGQRTYLAAMLVEIIHTASLIHDDVIDEADTRRGRASANAKWQSRNAVVLGDYLLARTDIKRTVKTSDYSESDLALRVARIENHLGL